MPIWVYMLKCRDDSYYVGSHRGEDVMTRVAQHDEGIGGDYTSRRRPVTLVWSETFDWATDAIALERRLKGWSRAKKEALIPRRLDDDLHLVEAARRVRASLRGPSLARRAPQDEDFGGCPTIYLKHSVPPHFLMLRRPRQRASKHAETAMRPSRPAADAPGASG